MPIRVEIRPGFDHRDLPAEIGLAVVGCIMPKNERELLENCSLSEKKEKVSPGRG